MTRLTELTVQTWIDEQRAAADDPSGLRGTVVRAKVHAMPLALRDLIEAAEDAASTMPANSPIGQELNRAAMAARRLWAPYR